MTKAPEIKRDKKGGFLKGFSGNPSGKPKTLFDDGKGGQISAGDLFRRNATEVHERLLAVIRDPATPHAPLISAIKEYNDRAYGRPAQALAISTKRDESLDLDMTNLSDEQLAALSLVGSPREAD
ncbi:MAG TPA: hypothetical protein VGW40_02870 [Allosphingosinicella sp.]|nr:hypothetical protein [Allosphingosinicella sp.]